MPKDHGKNDEQNLKLSIQVFTCYEAKQPHIPKDGAAWRQVDKTSGWHLKWCSLFMWLLWQLMELAWPSGIYSKQAMQEGRFQGVMTKGKQRQFLSQNKCLYPIDQKDFFRFIACLHFFHILYSKGKGTEETFWLVGKKGFTKPLLVPPPVGKVGKWSSHFIRVLLCPTLPHSLLHYFCCSPTLQSSGAWPATGGYCSLPKKKNRKAAGKK